MMIKVKREARREAEANAPRPRRRRTDHGVRNVRLVGGRGVAGWLAGRDRNEGWRVRADRGSETRSGRERRGGLDLPGPGRLRGRGALPDGVRRFLRGGHGARGPAEGLGAPRNVSLTTRVTKSSLDLVTLHGEGEVHRRRR